MIPVWLQLVTALSAAVTAGVMGAALVPFLTKLRLCDREKTGSEESEIREVLRPTMGGLLLCGGILFALVLGMALFREFGYIDRTGDDYRMQCELLRTVLLHGIVLAAAGFVTDLCRVRGRLRFRMRLWMLLGAVLLLTLGLLALQEGLTAAIVIPAVVTALCWQLIQTAEKSTDGMSITLGTVQLLMLTVVLLKEKQALPALYTLAAAGACMGCMVWNLHPAKCRLGCTGCYLLGSIVPLIAAAQGRYQLLALTMAVYLVNALPLLKPGDRKTLLERMERSGIAAWKRITILAAFAVFCGILAVLTA